MRDLQAGRLAQEELDAIYADALRGTIRRFEETGSPVLTDGEQTKPSFATYAVHGLRNLAPDGIAVPFADGHTRQLPRLVAGPFRYQTHASTFLEAATNYTRRPLKQAVISASLLSLLYPQEGIAGYRRDDFIQDLVREAVEDIRGCLDGRACKVQIDFSEARLSLKLDPSGGLLQQFIDLNNQVLGHFTVEERQNRSSHLPRRRSGRHA